MPKFGVHHMNEEIAVFEATDIEAACKSALQILKPELRATASYDVGEFDRRKQVTIDCEHYGETIFVCPAYVHTKPYVKWEIFTGGLFAAWLAGNEAGPDAPNPYPGE